VNPHWTEEDLEMFLHFCLVILSVYYCIRNASVASLWGCNIYEMVLT
jgi:hypothetical protein